MWHYLFCDMKLIIGKILKAQGIKGEVKLGCAVDDSKMLKNVKVMYIGSSTYTVEKLRFDGAFCYVTFVEVTDRNTAETLRNKDVWADKENIVVDSGRYFIDDFIGCKVALDDGREVGAVEDVLQYGSADVIVCGKVSFPFVKDLVISIDVCAKIIVLNAKRFAEVSVYED